MAIFNSKLLVHQRVTVIDWCFFWVPDLQQVISQESLDSTGDCGLRAISAASTARRGSFHLEKVLVGAISDLWFQNVSNMFQGLWNIWLYILIHSLGWSLETYHQITASYTWLYMVIMVIQCYTVFFVWDDRRLTHPQEASALSALRVPFLSAGRKVHLLRRGGWGWRQGGTCWDLGWDPWWTLDRWCWSHEI